MIVYAVVAQRVRPSLTELDARDEQLIDVCLQCWSDEPDARPTASQLMSYLLELSHPSSTLSQPQF